MPISTTAAYGLVIVAKADSGLKTVGDIIAAAKAKPGKLNFGTINPGSNQHLAAELFRSMTHVDVAMIPHKTTPDLITALLRGDVDVVFEYEAGLGAMMTDPRVAVVAYTGPQRLSHLPDVPTVAESGLPGYDVTSWNGLAAPKGTPHEIVEKLSHEVDRRGRAARRPRRDGEVRHGGARLDLRGARRADQDRHRQMGGRDREGRHSEEMTCSARRGCSGSTPAAPRPRRWTSACAATSPSGPR